MIACTTESAIVSILLFAFTQIVSGWVGHSMAHNRHPFFLKYGRIVAAIVGGFSLEWWSPKHNMHHIFTNSQLYDDDIKHDYKVYLYEFLYLKWRFDSAVSAITKLNYVTIQSNSARTRIYLNKLLHHFLQLPKPAIFPVGKFIGRILLCFCSDRKSWKITQVRRKDQAQLHRSPNHHLQKLRTNQFLLVDHDGRHAIPSRTPPFPTNSFL